MTSLSQHMDLEWMLEAFRRTRKDGAIGIDEMTSCEYEKDLEANLCSLLERAKSGDRYKAPPVKRIHIPKGDGGTRPLGIPCFEDKILQRAVIMLLEPLYEQDFLDCSYGFRTKRSPHQALKEIQSKVTCRNGGWILDVDISKFFDTIDHGHLREMLAKRMRDGVVSRLIGKWLNAGVLEDGIETYPEFGTQQGGVISPMLANIYLHYVLDVWFAKEVQPRLRGWAFIVRYADDVVMGFANKEDADKVALVLPKRLGRFGLKLNLTKTKLVEFLRPGIQKEPQNNDSTSFDFLGFTHYWAKSRKGFWIVKQKTSKSRFARALEKVKEWCRKERHLPVQDQHKALVMKLKGHYGYYGVTGNGPWLGKFRNEVGNAWHKWLSRRSQKAKLDWQQFARLKQRYPLPTPIVAHSIYRPVAKP